MLSSSGSFKRFESIDHDYRNEGQTSLISPTWNLAVGDIPPQPLRPAPAPLNFTKEKMHSEDKIIKQRR